VIWATITIKKITSGGTVTNDAGDGNQGSTDGALLSGQVQPTRGIAVDKTATCGWPIATTFHDPCG